MQVPMVDCIISHKNCPDGAACVLLARFINPRVQTVFTNHLEINNNCLRAAYELPPQGILWICDICPDQVVFEKILKILSEKNASCHVFEHHISRNWLASYDLTPFPNCTILFDTTRCASLILWTWLKSSMPKIAKWETLVFLVNDRDLWKNTDPRSTWLFRLHFILDDEGFVTRFLKNSRLASTANEKVILQYQEKKEEHRLTALLSTLTVFDHPSGYKYGIIYGTGVGSELLHQALEQKNLEYAMLVNLHAKRVAIRSKGNFDCAEYAQSYGGGGHRCAAGFPISFSFPKID